jgi:hypothetical protein
VPKQGDVHVVPSESGWRVGVEGTTRARSTHKTQAEAAKAARQIARKNKSELLIHGRNGRFATAAHTVATRGGRRANAGRQGSQRLLRAERVGA